jgi:hypothetical protein
MFTKHFYLIVASFFIIAFTGCSKKDTIPNPVNSENTKALGASANDLLSAAKYSSVKIEIQYMPGFQPDAAAINNLVTFLNSLVNKPGGISFVQSQIPSANKVVLSVTEIAAIEKANRTVFTSGSQLGIYILYTDGNYTQNNVLGVAYYNTSLAIMGKTVHDNSGGLTQPTRTKLESTILGHETGHILGLVNLGSPMQTNHEDPANSKHCNNSNCLMYYITNTTGIMGTLMSGNVPPLDANCKADLTANGGK